AKRRCSYDPVGKEGEGVLVGSASRSKRLARVVVVCARGSMRVSELAAEEDALARLTGNDLEEETPGSRVNSA
ncbi:MAG TPA: hypothetical protein VN927_05815, partial [Gemmatimonadaceae bacterium]|nr:hypothetical protein [Gemmatimonadaceae bacterium]